MTATSSPAYPGAVTTAATTAEKLPVLVDALRGQVVAGVRIHDLHAEIKPGAEGDTVVRLTLLVDDPRPGTRTWPVETRREIERRAQDEAWRLGVPEWTYVALVALGEADDEGEFVGGHPITRR